MKILQCSTDELLKLEDLAKQFIVLSSYPSFSWGRFISSWTDIINRGIGAIFVMYENAIPIGAIGGFAYPDLYSGEIIATEFMWFVEPKHRGHGLDLYFEFEKWAKEKNAKRIRMTHLCKVMPEGMKVLYSELGFEAIEVNYDKELKS
jgi:GNAT superfamily N-acetyltransferase